MKFNDKMRFLMDMDLSDINKTQEVARLFECVEEFALKMKKRLLNKYIKTGWTGWSEKGNFSPHEFQARIVENVQSGEPIDVANLAMFWWYNEGKKSKIENGG